MMTALSETPGWNYFADWTSANTLKNFPAVNILTALSWAWRERIKWQRLPQNDINQIQRNMVSPDIYADGFVKPPVDATQNIAFWWKRIIPHIQVDGKFEIWMEDSPPVGGGCGWRAYAIKPEIDMPETFDFDDVPLHAIYPYTVTVPEMEALIEEQILPYPEFEPAHSARYYFQFYKIIKQITRRWFTAAPPAGLGYGWSTNFYPIADATAVINRPDLIYVHAYFPPGRTDLIWVDFQVLSGQYTRDCNVYIRYPGGDWDFLSSPKTGDAADFPLYKNLPTIPGGAPFTRQIMVNSLEDRLAAAEDFVFRADS